MEINFDKITGLEPEELEEFKESLKPEEFLAWRDKLIHDWESNKILLDETKEKEMKLRLLLVEFAGSPEIVKGSDYVDLYNGYQLKIDKKITYALVKDDEKIDKILQEIYDSGPDGGMIASQIVKTKKELSLSFYNTIPASYREIAEKMVESKKALPTIEILEPKAKKTTSKFK